LKFTKKRIESQIKPDGSQPFEMARTKSLGYCVMNLTGFFLLADLGNKIKVDLWHYESPSGASLQKAYTYLLPYLTREKAWPHQQIVPFDDKEGQDLVRWGDRTYLSK
ncbi:MAG: alginate lyase family protein, partial [Aquirufa sp.]